ncbi:PIN domain-containing protein [Candidatus Neptunochlamydia vexilliferae]|nr:PIN domain-containing protein [Candidatus Neptunochlamydia vexilliferae]
MPILKELKKHKLLIDTQIWIWAMVGDPKLQKPFQRAFERALEANSILVSSMSVWEIGMLVEKKWIKIDMDTLVLCQP